MRSDEWTQGILGNNMRIVGILDGNTGCMGILVNNIC